MGFEVNTVTLSGNLTRDPELRSTGSGTSVCSLRLACNERRKNGQSGEWEDRPNYFDVTIWKGLGEWVANNMGKGDKIVVSGRLSWREWQDKDGNKRQTVEVVANDVVTPGGGGSGGPRSSGSAPAPDDDLAPAASGGRGMPDDDIPFACCP